MRCIRSTALCFDQINSCSLLESALRNWRGSYGTGVRRDGWDAGMLNSWRDKTSGQPGLRMIRGDLLFLDNRGARSTR